MTPEIGVGELVVIESTGIESVQVGQNAVFVSLSGMLKGSASFTKSWRSVTTNRAFISAHRA
ncbi:MAG: hypothetical protein ACLRTQ_01535 [Candidatus Borkfalkia sp.]